MSIQGESDFGTAIDIGDLDDLQFLLMWQKKYAFEALKRATGNRENDKQLFDLYTVTHGRDLEQYLDGEDPLPLSGKCQSSDFGFICGEEDGLPLTIVATSRNDTHVERMEDRTQAFIDGISFLANKYKAPVELILVEWNPPIDRPSMAEAFSFPEADAFLTTRIITVSQEIHSTYEWAKTLPLYQMIAKNVGVRRARGRQILATNVDILFSEELFCEIVSTNMTMGKIYRSNRWDVDRKILDVPTSQSRLAEAKSMHFQINYREGIYPRDTHPAARVALATDAALRYENTNVYQLHTEACGDFQMLHRSDWLRVRGYSELDAYSFHLDSLFALTCQHAGLKEEILEGPHFHIDHTLGVKVKSDSYEINEKAVVKHISLAALSVLDVMQLRANDFYCMNDENWGLAGYCLPDETVTKAGWDTEVSSNTAIQAKVTQSSLIGLSQLTALVDKLTVGAYLDLVWPATVEFVRSRVANRPLFIWGAGKRAMFTKQALVRRGLNVQKHIHGGDGKYSGECSEREIELASEFLERQPGSCFVVVASIFADDIVAVLVGNGWAEGRDYIVSI